MMKSTLTVSLLFVLSISYSQSPALDALVADYERGKAMSLAYIDAMPDDQFGFQPNADVRTFSQQMLHASQGMIGLSANGTGADKIYDGETLESDATLQTKAEVKRITEEAYNYAISSIKNMTPEMLDEIVERGPFKINRMEWVKKALEHASHHRGQCAVYLRLNNITPPQYKLF